MWRYGVLLGLSLLVAMTGIFIRPGEWYADLIKPGFTPPNWAFGPAWSYLYITMAIAMGRVWRQKGWPGARDDLMLYGAQLVFNAMWSFVFFGQHLMLLGFIDIVFLLAVVVLLTVRFFRCDHVAGWLFVPYCLWLAYAATLNFSLYLLN